MMKRAMVIGVAMIALLANVNARAGDCTIVNPSFEDDGRIRENEIETREPNGWQVHLPPNKFRAYVYTDWATDGQFNLTLYSLWFVDFDAGDTATVSQMMMNLTNLEKIVFDLKLETLHYGPWDPNVCTAVLLIDSDVVWESSSAGSDVRGEYRDQVYMVDDKYRDDALHEMSLGLRMNQEGTLWEEYQTQWDFFDCNAFCSGGGFLDGDINRDCYVDINDLQLLVEPWLEDVDPDHNANMFKGDDLPGYGTIDFYDYAVLADQWVGGFADALKLCDKWLLTVDFNDESNLDHGNDLAPAGIVNFFDFAILAENWLDTSYPPVQQE